MEFFSAYRSNSKEGYIFCFKARSIIKAFCFNRFPDNSIDIVLQRAVIFLNSCSVLELLLHTIVVYPFF